MRKFFLPIILSFLFILESIFVELFSNVLSKSEWILVPRFLIVACILLTIYGSKKQGIIYGLIFGLLFDIVYTEILGIYLFMFPIVAYLVSQFMRILQANVFITCLVTTIGVALLELGVYEMNFLIKITDMDFTTFAYNRLFPTLILNLAFTIIVIYPLKRFFEKSVEEAG